MKTFLHYCPIFYNLDVVISVGYRVHSVQGTRSRQWATQRIHEYIIKDYTLDDCNSINYGLKHPIGTT